MSENHGVNNSIAQLNFTREIKKSLKHLSLLKGKQFIILSPFLSLSGKDSVTYCNQVQYDTAFSTVRFRIIPYSF